MLILGTIFAAFMAAVFSYFNLVNSKEQKVSEFRQAWIDGFRNELATLTSAIYFISYYCSSNQSIKATEIEDSHKEYVSACTALLTRINAQDPNIQTNHVNGVFLEALSDIQNAFNNGEWNKVNVLGKHLIDRSKPLLKSEWNRVKLGEKSYRRNKNVAGFLCFSGFLISVLFLYRILSL